MKPAFLNSHSTLKWLHGALSVPALPQDPVAVSFCLGFSVGLLLLFLQLVELARESST
jgi:hypothetical protein